MKKYVNKLIQFQRRKVADTVYGVLLDYNKDLTLISVVDGSMRFDGYAVIPNDTVTSYSTKNKNVAFVAKALRLQGQGHTRAKGFQISGLAALLKTASKKFHLITVHRDLIDNTICHVGSVESVAEKKVVLRLINSYADPAGRKSFLLKDVTKITFGGNYERCLWLVANKKTKSFLCK